MSIHLRCFGCKKTLGHIHQSGADARIESQGFSLKTAPGGDITHVICPSCGSETVIPEAASQFFADLSKRKPQGGS